MPLPEETLKDMKDEEILAAGRNTKSVVWRGREPQLNELTSAFDMLKKSFPGYESRPQQLEMAGEVYSRLKEKKNLLIEAGTGVGKSFAYLIPAILSGEKTIVSTATIALQDQLVNKDLSFLQNILPQSFSYAILKGKNNYLCLKREREFAELSEQFKKFREWVSTTETGDKDELHFVPDFWSKVCGDSNDCSSVQCPFYSNCFYYRHYRELRKRDILVVNHHLLVFDLLSGFNLLPFHKQLIIDEAHQIENVISQVFGDFLSHSRLLWLLYRLRGLKIAVDHIFEPVEVFFRRRAITSHAVSPIPDAVIEELKNLKRLLALDRVIQRLIAYKESISDDELNDRIDTTINYIDSLSSVINDFIEQGDSNKVYYLSGNKNAIELKSNLVESQKPFHELINGYESLIMTSATLTTGGDFRFLKDRLVITEPISGSGTGFKEMVIGSPFNYKKQSMLYLDKELPSPDNENNKTFYQESLKTIEGLLMASRGRALVLFTSYKHLNFISEHIKIDYPFKTQGDMPSSRLIKWFRKTSDPVLLATTTFWQGIDIKGEKLSLVIIAKIPFGSPGDPVYDERCRRLGEHWFKDLALPSAILLLRQGFGRLIRGVDDYGVVAILDTRLILSSYGKAIISSLPEMNIAHSTEDVKRFFDSVPKKILSENPPSPHFKIPLCPPLQNGDRGGLIEKNHSGISRVIALGNSNDPSAITELIDFTKSKDGNERRLTASALGKLAKFKPDIYEAVNALEILLEDEKPQVRHYAMKALGKIAKGNHEKLEAVINNPHEKEYNVSLARRLIKRQNWGQQMSESIDIKTEYTEKDAEIRSL